MYMLHMIVSLLLHQHHLPLQQKQLTARPLGDLSEDIQSSPARHGVKNIRTACHSDEEEEHVLDAAIEYMQLLEAINSLHQKHK